MRDWINAPVDINTPPTPRIPLAIIKHLEIRRLVRQIRVQLVELVDLGVVCVLVAAVLREWLQSTRRPFGVPEGADGRGLFDCGRLGGVWGGRIFGVGGCCQKGWGEEGEEAHFGGVQESYLPVYFFLFLT